jgi:hypothetical protein
MAQTKTSLLLYEVVEMLVEALNFQKGTVYTLSSWQLTGLPPYLQPTLCFASGMF